MLSRLGCHLAADGVEYFERQLKPELRPPDSRLVSYLHIAFPNDVRPPER